MSGETAGQLVCIAWNEHYAEQHGIEARNEWAASDPRGRGAWEAAAAAGETEQVRLARQDRDQLREHVLSLAAAWGDLAVKCDEAAALDGMAKAAVRDQATFARQLRECAAALRKAAEPPD